MESMKKGLSINYLKTECIVVSQSDSPRCEFRIRNAKIIQVQKCNLPGSVVENNGKCDPEGRRHIELEKDVFQQLSKVSRQENIVTDKKR